MKIFVSLLAASSFASMPLQVQAHEKFTKDYIAFMLVHDPVRILEHPPVAMLCLPGGDPRQQNNAPDQTATSCHATRTHSAASKGRNITLEGVRGAAPPFPKTGNALSL